MDPIEAGQAFVEERFPEALCAFVAGSFLRGEATPTSDLDIVVLTTRDDAPFRASYREHEWPIEVFVHTTESYRWYFTNNGDRASLAAMCLEGVIVRDTDGLARRVRAEAHALIERGPESLTPEEVESRRYGLTDTLDDFLGCDLPGEGILIAAVLVRQASELVLRLNRQWTGGQGKWALRALRRYDPTLAQRVSAALERYAAVGDKEALVRLADEVLETVGGRLFEGYYSRGTRPLVTSLDATIPPGEQ